ncbi:2-succinyl-6-hydroxy-2,4-cyclohexadiene-1-carboxylate synthase [Ornithinibacillus scapharcae]|uniref:2-succinyl-6-hydroxy-2, 4-cyclohexadiene-1-carboxylate synthase n=1 Tax=Ornithinibacillus scapharcae TaxID=1147159 RepID=UPI000225B669|nr:2-succinyl-6-hydroxy-2,4-cyclohexadiene-1-carboxylate synthase [Ornithinibacillus scapharcae]
MKKLIRDSSYWYEVHGEGEALVLLHGFTGSTQTWNHIIQTFRSSFQIIVIDLPGHGKTVSHSPISMEQCCTDIRTLLVEIGIDSCHMIGYSMGGRTALSFSMLYPDMVKSLVLESASAGLDLEEDRHSRRTNDEKLAQKLEREGLESFIDFWESIPLFESQKNLSLETQNEIRKERLSQNVEGLAMSLRSMGTGSQPSWWPKLSLFNKPVLLIAGELDSKFVSINKRMHEALPQSQLTIVKQAGHAIHVEQPEFFGKIIEMFIFVDRK